MKKLGLIAFLGFSAAAFCVNQGNSQTSKVQFNTAAYNMSADTAPMKTTKKTVHKTTKKTTKPKSDSTKA